MADSGGGTTPPSQTLQEKDQLCLYFGKFRVKMNKAESDKATVSLNNSSPGSSSNATPTGTKQEEVDFNPKYESGFKNSPSVPIPLYSQGIWKAHGLNGEGHFLGSSTLNGCDNDHQQRNLTGNLTGLETTKAKFGFGGPSSSLCNSYGDNAASVLPSGQDYRSGGNSEFDHFVATQNSSAACQSQGTEGIGIHDANNYWYQSSVGNQSSFDNDGCHGDHQTFELQRSREIGRVSRTPIGSQFFLHCLLIYKDPSVTNMIFKGVYESIFEVMSDSYGNHLFGKLIESCNYIQLQLIVAKLSLNTESLINTSITKYGSKSIQRLIKVLEKSPLLYMVTSALSSVFEELMTNRIGSFVIFKCLSLLETEKNKKIYEEAVRLCITLALNEKGCIYLNEFITYSKPPYRDQILDQLSSKSKFLSQDPSGNFVIQHILGLHNPVFTAKICYELRNLYIQLSSQKGGSHVVEKCLNSSAADYVVSALLMYDKLHQIARDQFGNYVIQTALKATKRANSPLHQVLLGRLEEHRSAIQFGYGKKVLILIDNGIPLD